MSAASFPDCGACPGNGTICQKTCRVLDESPKIEPLFIIESRVHVRAPWRPIPSYPSQPLTIANVDCGWLNENVTCFEYRVVVA